MNTTVKYCLILAAAFMLLVLSSCARPVAQLRGFGESELVLPAPAALPTEKASALESGFANAAGALCSVEKVSCGALEHGFHISAVLSGESDANTVCAALKTYLLNNNVDSYSIMLTGGVLVKERGCAPEYVPYAEKAAVAEQPSVWITSGGSKYHIKEKCGGIKNAIFVTLAEALDMGRTPCSRCCK